MAAPLNKAILDEIGLRLALITTTNEYHNTMVTVKRARLEPFKGYDLPAVNYWPVNLINSVNQYGQDNREVNIIIEAHTKTRDEPFTDVCDRLAADIVTALNRKTTGPKVSDDLDLDLGGIVSDFTCSGYDYQIGQGQEPFCGIVLTFVAKFNTGITTM